MGYTWQEAREAWHSFRRMSAYISQDRQVLDQFFQQALDDEREAAPIESVTFRAGCPTRQEQDEYVCSKCLLRWGVEEERPPCRRKLR